MWLNLNLFTVVIDEVIPICEYIKITFSKLITEKIFLNSSINHIHTIIDIHLSI